jgi:hypothetical protein
MVWLICGKILLSTRLQERTAALIFKERDVFLVKSNTCNPNTYKAGP